MSGIIDTCEHCQRSITYDGGLWVDPLAIDDDVMWREVCDHNTEDFQAYHEPMSVPVPRWPW